jgi:hypothetical protein
VLMGAQDRHPTIPTPIFKMPILTVDDVANKSFDYVIVGEPR